MKAKQEFSPQELEDIWSSLEVWDSVIDKKENPKTVKDIRKLIKKVKKFLGHG